MRHVNLESINTYLESKGSSWAGMYKPKYVQRMIIKHKPTKLYVTTNVLLNITESDSDRVDKLTKLVLNAQISGLKDPLTLVDTINKNIGGINHVDGCYYILGHRVEIALLNDNISRDFNGIVAVDEHDDILAIYKVAISYV